MYITRNNVLLIDGLGALTSSFFLGIILPSFDSLFTVPQKLLYPLALIALGLCVYSLSCHFLAKGRLNLHLTRVIAMNAIYSVITLAAVSTSYKEFNVPGISYFVSELIILSGLIWTEFQVLRKAKP